MGCELYDQVKVLAAIDAMAEVAGGMGLNILELYAASRSLSVSASMMMSVNASGTELFKSLLGAVEDGGAEGEE